MTIAAIVEQPSTADDRRQDIRWRMRLELPGSPDRGEANVVIHDLSTAGMLIETGSQFEIGQSIAIILPEAGTATAHVVWQDGQLFGCRFDQPVAQVAISAARLRNPIAIAPTPAAEPLPAAPAREREALPERLLRLRRERGISRAALSVRTGFSKPSIWAWETGKTVPRRANLLVLAEAFGLTEQQLLLAGDESPTAAAGGDTAGQLRQTIEEARSRIAAMAGVEKSKVHISIDF